MQFEDIFIADKRAREMTAGARRRFDDAAREADAKEKLALEEAARRALRDAAAQSREAKHGKGKESDADGTALRIRRLAELEKANTDRWVDEIYARVVSDS